MERKQWSEAGRAGVFLAWACLGLAEGVAGGEAPPIQRESVYSRTTLLVCNSRDPESVALAEYYAKARGIPEKNLLRLALNYSEEISRAVYETKIAGPLREMLLRHGWWMPERDETTGQQTLRSQFHFLVLFRGIPLRIRAARQDEPPLESSAASVDSELIALGQPGAALEGPLANPYFCGEVPFAQAGLPIQLVGRIDGSSAAECRQMIDGALLAEREGLWGNAYVDVAQEEGSGLGAMHAVAAQLRKEGVPVTLNRFARSFPVGYPMRDPAFFFVSEREDLEGFLSDSSFRFRPGAVAAQRSDGSAASVRDARKSWAAAFLQRGAAAAVGTVAPTESPHALRLDFLVDRLLRGHTLLESASMALESMSWMGVVVGDPLYRPFPATEEGLDEHHFRKDDMLPYKVIRLAHGRWGGEKPLPEQELILKLEMASAKLPRPELIEHLGLLSAEMGNLRDARTHFLRARNQYAAPEDQLRMELHLADLAWSQNEKVKAFKIWREAADTFRQIPASRAATEYLKVFQTAQQ